MKKQVIVLTFNGDSLANRENNGGEIVFPGLSLRKNLDDCKESEGFNT